MRTALLLLLMACSDPYAVADKANTIEAWETYLKEGKPSLSQRLNAEQALQVLLLERARKTKTVADYDALLKRFDKVSDRKSLVQERAEAAYLEAEKVGTPEAWQAFLDENKDADSILLKRGASMKRVADYLPKLKIENVRAEQVNLAENPNGPKDGWGFFADFTNTGDKAVEFMNVEVRLLDDTGMRLKAYSWPLVSKTGPGNMPIQEEYTRPLRPGERRVWEYTTGEVPEKWSKKVEIAPVALRVEGVDDPAP